MSGFEKAATSLATALVVSWLVAYFAFTGAQLIRDSPDALEVVAVSVEAPPVLPTPEPAAPESAVPEPKQAEASKPEPSPVGERGIELGHELLASGGAFPALNASYESFGSFREYARSMIDLGAQFVVVKGRRIVAAADIETASVSPFEGGQSYSPIPRDYSSEPALAHTTRVARSEHGKSARVQMLLPREMDAGLFGGIAILLAARGEAPDEYTEIQGRYEAPAKGGIWFRVESGTRSDGAHVALSRTFDLNRLARGEGGRS